MKYSRWVFNANAENFNLKQKFDIIYAGDLIEHLSNVGLFLQCCKKHMNQNSLLIITTPNPFSFSLLIRSFINQFNPCPEHTMYLDRKNIQELNRRFNFKIVKFKYFTEKNKQHPIKKIIMRMVSYIFPYLNEEQMVVLKIKQK